MATTPRGLRDILPFEAAERAVVETCLRGAFKDWGYDEVVTPTFEYFDTLAAEAGEGMQEVMYKFFDRSGKLLALRPEVTTPIARMVVGRLMDEPPPYRMFYLANVFREEKPQRGQQREFRQAGIELIGSQDVAADAEVVALMIEALERLGLRNFKVGLGQIEIFKGALERPDLSEADLKKIKATVVRGDLVGLDEVAREVGLSAKARERLVSISRLRGGEEVLLEAEKFATGGSSLDALESLSAVFGLLKSYGVGDYVLLDLGIIRNFDYYTGIIFEAYAQGVGFPIGGGGRYDKLLAEFGAEMPAAGFALGVERTHIALADENRLPKINKAKGLVFAPADQSLALRLARQLRQNRIAVEIALERLSEEEADQMARERGSSWLLMAAANGDSTFKDLEAGTVRAVSQSNLLNVVGAYLQSRKGLAGQDGGSRC